MEHEVILDANVWIAFLRKNDTTHERARKVFGQIKGIVILPEYVLLEVVTVLSQKVGKEYSNRFLQMVTGNKEIIIVPSSSFFLSSLVEFYLASVHSKLSFVDHALLYLSKEILVITFDKALHRALRLQNSSS